MSNINNYALKQNTILYGKSHTYTIEKILGQGSFGITYLAMTQVKVSGALGELETTIQVAIKEFFMKDINGREENTVTCGSRGGVYYDYKKKFSREAENLSKLNHPHIVKVLEYFEANNTVYYAMEYVDGGNLDTYITQQKGLTEAESIMYAKQIGDALSYMHAHKMLHLDLKPGNIMLRKNQEAVLIDFGLSKQYDENGKPETSTTVGSGTPGYAPIEQSNYHEGKDFPATMDVYALGATMYKMLTGIRPPEASEILNDGFPAYELQKRQVSDSLIASIAKVMSAMKKDRPQSVAAFLSILENNMPTIGDLTVAFWMRTTKNTSAQGLFSIPNSIKFWGNFDIFLENNNSETQAFFKVHIFNQTAKENDERWVEAKIDDIFGSEWVHLAFVYDGNTSTITVYRNGEGVFTKELPDCGKLKFNNVGASLAVGAFQFSTTPSLTSGAGAQTWAKNFPGQLDQFRLYDKVLTATEIQSIYSGKE